MDSPTAMSAGAETWTTAPYLISAVMHSTLGNAPSEIDAKFAITSPAPFPWIRMRAIDKIDGVVIAIWRFDSVKKSFDGNVMVWEAIGRDALYGIQDNSIRPPTRFLQPGGVNPDAAYTEWPTATLANAADFEEAAFPAVTEKVGPNYMNKAAKRGWIVKDMTRFAAGYAGSPSRPIIAVYNRGKDIIPHGQTTPLGDAAEGELLRSNFAQAQGDSANQLIRDVTKSWPWTAQEGVGIGYDYRAVWPGKVDPFAVSGQAMELFPRGSQVGGIPCIDFPVPCPDCPHPHIDGCVDCIPPSTRTCVSHIDIVVDWHRTFSSGAHALFTPIGPGGLSVGIVESGAVDHYFAGVGYNNPCGVIVPEEQPCSDAFGGSVACGTIYIKTATTTNSLTRQTSVTSIPTPGEACSAAAPTVDPFTDYVTFSTQAAWATGGVFYDGSHGTMPWECDDKAAFIAAPTDITINLYVGTLQTTDCSGTQADYWVDIGDGNATIMCPNSISLSYAVYVPSSLCYFENGGTGVGDAVQAFVDGGLRQTLDDAICNTIASLVPPTAPDNDMFVNAVTVTSLPFSATLSTSGATTEPGEPVPSCVPTIHTVWYKFTPLTDMTIKADTFGSDFDTVLGVYTGTTIDNLVELICNDDDPDCGCVQSKVTFPGVAGTTYYFQAGSFDGTDGGTMIFNLYDPPTPLVCIPPISVEVTADNMSIYSRSRAMGMGTSNANETTTALVTHMEDTWNPTAGQYSVKREILANDYGINDANELDNLARSYLLSKTNAQHGYITLLVTLSGFLKAVTGPFLTKPLQAGDSVDIGAGLGIAFNIEAGPYVVDNIVYTWPEDISKMTCSQRPASLTDAPGAGGVRNIGMSSAGEGEIFESDWIDPLPFADAGTGFPCVIVEHNLGVIPTKVLIVAALHRIQNWYDSAEVDAAQPLFVTPAYFDVPIQEWVGYRVVSADENRILISIANVIAATERTYLTTRGGEGFSHFFKVFLNV
jgi:hypothetical protein